MKLILSLILFASICAEAVTIPIDCTYSAITNALLTTAQEGDVVLIGPGTCTISNQIIIDRNISFTIRGSGTNETTLISTGDGGAAIWVRSNSTNVFTVSDLNCVGHVNDQYGFLITGGNPPTTPMRGPVHYYNLKMTNVVYRGISIGGGDSFGLIDHCYMESRPGNPQFINFDGNSQKSWTNPIPFGTTNACYVEDCTFINGTNGGNGYFDAYNGAQLVFRHNFCNGYAPSGAHGYDSGFSPRSWEVYNNVFTNYSSGLVLQWRGGSGYVFSNAVYGTNVQFTRIDYYRSCPPSHLYFGEPLPLGVPGKDYEINFAGKDFGDTGLGLNFSGNPTNGDSLLLGSSVIGNRYGFTNTYADATSVGGVHGGYVLIGATVAETCTNLYNALRLGTGAGTTYSASMPVPEIFTAVSVSETNVILRCIIDGTNDFGYPAAFQSGTITCFAPSGDPTTFVNSQTLSPCYAWSNTVNGTNDSGFTVGDNNETCGYYITNLIKLDRDYFNAEPDSETYTPLEYPHPLQAFEIGDSEPGADDQAPTVVVTSPGSTNRWHVTIEGTASDNVGVDHVTVSVNGGTAVTATGTTNWSALVDLREGANLIQAKAFDAFPNFTTTNATINFVPGQRVRLRGIRSAGGTLRSN